MRIYILFVLLGVSLAVLLVLESLQHANYNYSKYYIPKNYAS